LLFPGYGQSSESLQYLHDFIPERELIIVDPILLGDSNYTGSRKSISKAELKAVLTALLEQEKLETLKLCGYSLGTRYAMNFLSWYPNRVESVFFLAPDGIVLNFWNRAMAYSSVGKFFYRQLVSKPSFFNAVMVSLQRVGLLRPSLARFAKLHTADSEKREMVLRMWVLLKDVHPDLSSFSENLRQYGIPIDLVFGKYDRVITQNVKRKALKSFEAGSVEVVEAGYDLLKPSAVSLWIGKA
jgi:pimeloyl-ACP methyl ester carboxylesterase